MNRKTGWLLWLVLLLTLPAAAQEPPSGSESREEHLRRTGEVSTGNLPHVPKNLAERYTPLLGERVWLRLGGFLQVDAFQDGGAQAGRFSFTPSQLESDGTPALTALHFGFRQTRLTFDAYTPYPELLQGTRFYVEGDFSGKNGAANLRHAFVALPYLILGRTDSAFRDTDAEPEKVDSKGPSALFGNRQQGVRVLVPLGGWRLALAAEDPGGNVTPNGFVVTDDRLRDSIDFAAHLRANEDWGHVQLSGLVRNIKSTGYPGQPESFKGWGVALSGSGLVGEKDNIQGEFAMGDGIGRYISDLSGTSSEVGLDASGKLNTQFARGGYLAYQHWWDETMRSTVYASFVDVDVRAGQPADSYRSGQKIAVNLMVDLTKNLRAGAEVMAGRRVDLNGETSTGRRLQFMLRWSFQ